ncbi:MAG: hypothetical protein KF699_02660 [Phycisphaeraceae bacterium]|nr:hypothetical protein [Phycisphaeraceae bacterium]MBX3406666.1 hypothetical protein [Phycisphaeraceae bacterium]
MSQFGMQMPGGASSRSASMNIYTGLLFVAVVALIAACAWMFVQGAKIAPDGQPFKMHGDKVQLR